MIHRSSLLKVDGMEIANSPWVGGLTQTQGVIVKTFFYSFLKPSFFILVFFSLAACNQGQEFMKTDVETSTEFDLEGIDVTPKNLCQGEAQLENVLCKYVRVEENSDRKSKTFKYNKEGKLVEKITFESTVSQDNPWQWSNHSYDISSGERKWPSQPGTENRTEVYTDIDGNGNYDIFKKSNYFFDEAGRLVFIENNKTYHDSYAGKDPERELGSFSYTNTIHGETVKYSETTFVTMGTQVAVTQKTENSKKYDSKGKLRSEISLQSNYNVVTGDVFSISEKIDFIYAGEILVEKVTDHLGCHNDPSCDATSGAPDLTKREEFHYNAKAQLTGNETKTDDHSGTGWEHVETCSVKYDEFGNQTERDCQDPMGLNMPHKTSFKWKRLGALQGLAGY